MRRNFIYIIISLLGWLFILPGCTDEVMPGSRYEVKEGVPVSVTLKYSVAAAQSRATDEEEKKVNSLCVLAFLGEEGMLSAKQFYSSSDISGKSLQISSILSGKNRIFLIANYSNSIANLEDALRGVENYNDFKEVAATFASGHSMDLERSVFLMSGQMKSSQNQEEWVTVSDQPNEGIVDGSPISLHRVDARIDFKVTAQAAAGKGYTNFVFTPQYYKVYNIPQGCYLVPQDNDYADKMENGYVSMESTPKYLEGQDNMVSFSFYMMENRKAPKKRIEALDKGTASTLYALREKKLKSEDEKPDGSKPGQTFVPGAWEYAPDKGTYVELVGNLSFTNADGQMVNAQVSYVVHLGNTGNSTVNREWYDNTDLVNDYNTERNYKYTYNVTITDVESIEVEVSAVDEAEPRPGMEGDVIVAGGEVQEMDAHYGRIKFTLKRSDIVQGLSWAFSTPLQRGMKVFNKEITQTTLEMNDYKWVKFAINKEYPFKEHSEGDITNKPHDNYYCRDIYVKYPGEAAYDGGTATTAAPASGGTGAKSDYYNNQTVVLYDINQLLNHLYEVAIGDNPVSVFDPINDSEDMEVTITAFVDEFVYYYDPTKIYYKQPESVTTEELALWKKSVNCDSRYLHFCKAVAQYSPDGNSSWAESVITIAQHPVYTMYNPNAEGLNSAWGTEAEIEVCDPGANYTRGEVKIFDNDDIDGELINTEKHLLFKDYTNSNSNGRYNTIQTLLGGGAELHWTDIESVYTNNRNLRKGYRDIWHACLVRNRDLDGDNIVDPEEIRWYLASIDQLTDLWIGESSLPNAKLYDVNTFAGSPIIRYHTASSTFYSDTDHAEGLYLNNYQNVYVLWGEEGASIGGYYEKWNGNWGGAYTQQNASWLSNPALNGGAYIAYRCVRNLGIPLDNIKDVPDDYAVPDSEEYTNTVDAVRYTEKRLDLSRLEYNSRRNYTPTLQPQMNERQNYNKPSNKLAMIIKRNNQDVVFPYSTRGSYSESWTTLSSNEEEGSPCPRGYRIPNQRELMLLYTTWREDFARSEYDYACKTTFSFNGMSPYGQDRYGFAYDGGNLYLITGSAAGFRVRCVRDILE